jgi:2-polyprenyl-6-methoxyphenol hydroxylase-like FAD-dependent oxidoreductase
VRRGVTVEAIELDPNNPVVVARDKSSERIAARFVVAADGRGSGVRKWAGFTTQKNVQPFHFAGVLLTEASGRNDIVTFLFNPDLGLVIASAPLPKQHSRAYLGYPTTDGLLVQGNEKLGTFMQESQKVAPNLAESYAQAKTADPSRPSRLESPGWSIPIVTVLPSSETRRVPATQPSGKEWPRH